MSAYWSALLGQVRYSLWVGSRRQQLAALFILGACVVALAHLGGAQVIPELVQGLAPGASLWVFVAVMAGITGPVGLIEETG